MNDARKRIAKDAVRVALSGIDYAPANDQIEIVGSAYIRDCETSDVDVLVYIPKAWFDAHSTSLEILHFPGWMYGGSDGACGSQWESFTQTVQGVEVNMLITNSYEYFVDWCNAAEVCRFLHLKGITLPTALVHGVHEIVMEGASAEDEVLRRDY